MNFEGLVPVIQCTYIEKTLEFYQQALRYIIISKTESDTGLQWAYIKSDNTYLMLQKNTETLPQTHNKAIVLHYFTSDVSAQHQFMTARGINVGQIEDTAYHVRQFFIEDPEGNKIAIGQDIKNK
ncbi:MAG: VOC family protein [Gammaproteobacteria bacterium]|nr:VOC family protein [Gammaproteobacteria bacterium]